MIKRVGALGFMLVVVAGLAQGSRGAEVAAEAEADGSRPPRGLSNGAGSVDQLLDRFLAALEKRDVEGLHGLRVTREEYLDIVVPGTVAKGQPPRQVSERPKQYFWEMLEFKSREFGKLLAERHGGRHYVDRQVEFSEPRREYAWYTAHGELRMRLQAEDDSVHELRSGWIAEVGGQFKFIGFEWDN
jgi:hypothetical protein